jgi:hypothetical protein
MAKKKISAMTPATSLTGTELIPIVQNGLNKTTTPAQIITDKVDKVANKSLSTNDLTDTLKGNYDAAYQHSQAAHAPSNAVALATVKNDADISDSLTKKHALGSDAETASSIINLGIDEIEYSLITSFLKQ